MLNNLSIRMRLVWNAVLASCFLTLVVVVSANGLIESRSGLVEMTQSIYPKRLSHSEMIANLLEGRGNESDMVASNLNPDEVMRHKRRWDESQKRADEQFRKLRAGTTDVDRAADLDKMWSLVIKYREGLEAFSKQLADNRFGDAEGAFGALKEPKENFDEALRQARRYADLLEHDVSEVATRVSSLVNVAITTLVVAFVLALALQLLMSWLAGRSIIRPIDDAVRVAEEIAGGNLAGQVVVQGGGETARMLQSLSSMQESLRSLVRKVHESADSMKIAASEVAAGNQDLSQRTERASSSLQVTSSSLDDLTTAVSQSAEHAQLATQLAANASAVAQRGGAVVRNVVSTMDEINQSSKKISDITGVIDGIAFQTNILALNAAVEAARAGEQGRGFAVVAAEVRNLAQRSAQAAKEIKTLISASVQKVDSGAKLVAEAGSTMDEIQSSIIGVTDIVNQITAAAGEQSSGIAEINTSVGTLDQMTQQNAALVEQSAAAAQSLHEQAEGLSAAISVFRLSNQSSQEFGLSALPSANAKAPAAAGPGKVYALSAPRPADTGVARIR